MPAADWLERPAVSYSHEVLVPLPPERALAHALSTPVAPDRLVAALFRLRGFDPRGTIETFGSTPPFTELRRSRTEWVAGVGWEPPGRLRAVVTLIARGDERGGLDAAGQRDRGQGIRREGRPPLPPLLAVRRAVLEADPPPLVARDGRAGARGPLAAAHFSPAA